MKKITLFVLFLTVNTLWSQKNYRTVEVGLDKTKSDKISDQLSQYEVGRIDVQDLEAYLQKDTRTKKIALTLPSGKSFSFDLKQKDIRSRSYESFENGIDGLTKFG